MRAAHIDWRALLSRNGIEFVERGANVRRGELNIRCPFCASADPSHHMGINPESSWWACWRNSAHRGKSPVRLLVALLRISVAQARDIAGLDEDYVDPEGFSLRVARFMGRVQTEEHPQVLRTPASFRPFALNRSYCARHLDYLHGRGFDQPDLVAHEYGMLVDISGPWRDRVILPYFSALGELTAWTGRAISPAEIRYKDLSVEQSLVPIKDSLYNVSKASAGGHSLVVVEGPFDALKLDWFGRDHGLHAVALSTNSIRESQLYQIVELSTGFQRVLVMMDMASKLGIVDSMKMRGMLGAIPNAEISQVPYGRKDAGELTGTEIWHFAAGVTA